MSAHLDFFGLIMTIVIFITIVTSTVRGAKVLDTLGPVGARWNTLTKLAVFLVLHAITALTWTLFWVWFDSPSLWVGVFIGYYVLAFGGQAWVKHLTKKPSDGWDSV